MSTASTSAEVGRFHEAYQDVERAAHHESDDLDSGNGSDGGSSDSDNDDHGDGAKGKAGDGKTEHPDKPKLSKKDRKRARKKRNDAKMRRLAATVGVEDNQYYPKFKEKERLLINISNTKYFVIRFTAKNLFNYKLSYKK